MKTLAQLGMVILLLLIETAHADTITELELYQASTVGPIHTDLSTEDVEIVSDDGILAYLIEKPSMENLFVSPPPVLITFPLSGEQLNKLEIAWIKRALREKKDAMYYVNKARASEAEQRALVKSSARSAFEIYPDSNLFSQFNDHLTCEQNYYHCSLNNYQLWLENQELKKQLMLKEIPNFADGANTGRLWKPEADPKARCKGGTTILLESGNSSESIDILDSNLAKIKSPSNFGKLDDGRPRFCAEGMPGSSFGSGPIYISAGEKLYRVNNPANRED